MTRAKLLSSLRARLRRPRAAVLLVLFALLAATAALLVPRALSTNASAEPVDKGIWISLAELKRLPKKGDAWKRLKAAADAPLGRPSIRNQDSAHDVATLAAALVFARTGKEEYREKAVAAIGSAIGTEEGGTTLALGRNLVSYVIAADLVNLREYAPEQHKRFTAWLKKVRNESLGGKTLISTHEIRPNNWGTMAGASRAAVAVYLGDAKDLERTAKVFQGWLGDRSSYSGFVWGKEKDLDWQVDPAKPVGINPPGAAKEGYLIDGALPPEMRRGGKFQFPPKHTDYPWGGLSGAVVLAEILERQGYDPWSWQDEALRRAVQFLSDIDTQYGKWWADGDDAWIPWVVNVAYDAEFSTEPVLYPGKNMSWTDWTHAAGEGPGG